MDIDKLIDTGKRLGLEGSKLEAFVYARENEIKERNERAIQREEEKREREIEETERSRKFEIEKLQLEVEIQHAKTKSGIQTLGTVNTNKPKGPKLPKFEEDRDDMDAFLERFERFAIAQTWDEDLWAVYLSPLLTGKGLQVYTSMSSDTINDYNELKTALLKRYELTEEGFRLKFRESKPEKGETAFQYISRMSRYLERWTDMAKIEKSFGGLKDLLIREQFIKMCSMNMALFLKERAPANVAEMTKLAEQYMEAHNKGSVMYENRQHNVQASEEHNIKYAGPMKRTNRITCFVCGEEGHIARDHGNGGQSSNSYYQTNRDYNNWRRNDYQTDTKPRSTDQKPKTQAALCQSMPADESPIRHLIENGELKLANGKSLPVILGVCDQHGCNESEEEICMPISEGYVGKSKVKVLRDTGCSSAAVRESLVLPQQLTNKEHLCALIDGTIRHFKIAKIWVDTPYFVGELEAMCMRDPIYDLVLGNIKGVTLQKDKDWKMKGINSLNEYIGYKETEKMSAVTTRAEAKKDKLNIEPLKVQVKEIDICGIDELKKEQRNDPSLQKLFVLADKDRTETENAKHYFAKKNEVLYRVYRQQRENSVIDIEQIVVPTLFRKRVMSVAHESIVGGHLGVRKTLDRILTSFHWPGINGDVTRFCQSCDICQKTIPKGRVAKVPLGEMPIIEEPFKRVAIDLIGPIYPISQNKNRYILTVVDYATRYPEAVALPKIETERVAEALLEVFSRVGFPQEILSDQGSQFTSGLMDEVCRLVSIKQLFTTPYNPKCNGWCERMNGVLKSMVKKMCQERPKDWDRYLPAVLFAYREVPQASTGFSPFELLYGRTIRGPMQALKEIWTQENDEPETKNTYQYVLELRNRLEDTCKIARESLLKSQGKYKHHYNKKAKDRRFRAGDKVLVLLPTDSNKLLLQWKGPFDVVEVINRMDYKVNIRGKIKTYHANLLKLYVERDDGKSNYGSVGSSTLHADSDDVVQSQAGIAIIEAESNDEPGVVDDENLLGLVNGIGNETYKDVVIDREHLSDKQISDVEILVQEYQDIFTELPGTTNVEEHDIETYSNEIIRVKPYPIPYSKRKDVQKEVESMIQMGVIEPSNSEFNAPIVLVKKKDGTNRFCIDFRKLNTITKFDPEPMANIEDLMTSINKDTYFSKIDLSKGYWQIPVAKTARHLTSFTTHDGCYQFTKMPFGLVNSGATFNRMMRKVLKGKDNVENYIDDILGHTIEWGKHIELLRDLFDSIRSAKLTVKPSKCMLGFQSLGFVGHTIGKGKVSMEDDKVEKIKNAPRPTTKKQVRSFLGLAGFYRKFIRNFSQIATPLTDLTKKGQSRIVKWGEDQENSFSHLKEMLTSTPVLRLPDLTRKFIVQSDASDDGVGAILLQEYDDGIFPVAFASKKFLSREKNYSVIERECLAIIFALKKFQLYLYGKEFVLNTDHKPLSYIQKCKIESGRIMRWALFLQNYKFRIEAIKGTANVGADYLSRSSVD